MERASEKGESERDEGERGCWKWEETGSHEAQQNNAGDAACVSEEILQSISLTFCQVTPANALNWLLLY